MRVVGVYAIPMATRFRGICERQGMIVRGEAGWAEWSPFLDYGPAEALSWLRAAEEACEHGYPTPLRDRVAVNAIIPAVDPPTAWAMTRRSGCATIKVKVAERGQSLGDDIARVEAVRDALGPQGRVRVDANGAWTVDQALAALTALAPFDLEYAEQPCASVEELATLRRKPTVGIPIAADESIRRAEDPYAVTKLGAADIAVIKVQPLGGVRACLRLVEDLGLPVVVSSAVETSIGLRAGVALAAALPELPYACGLNTMPLLRADIVNDSLIADHGWINVRDVQLDPLLMSQAEADESTTRTWMDRLRQCLRWMEDNHG